eukprot:scaffold112748_cov33-Phaeocystis_antarctica.AAC.1
MENRRTNVSPDGSGGRVWDSTQTSGHAAATLELDRLQARWRPQSGAQWPSSGFRIFARYSLNV